MFSDHGFVILILAILGFGAGVALLMVPIALLVGHVIDKDRKSWVTLPDPKKIGQYYEVTMWVNRNGTWRKSKLRNFVFVRSKKTGKLRPQIGTDPVKPLLTALLAGFVSAMGIVYGRKAAYTEEQQALVCAVCFVSMLLIFGTDELMTWIRAYRKLKKEINRQG